MRNEREIMELTPERMKTYMDMLEEIDFLQDVFIQRFKDKLISAEIFATIINSMDKTMELIDQEMVQFRTDNMNKQLEEGNEVTIF